MTVIISVVSGFQSLRANADEVGKQDGSEGDYGVLVREMSAHDACRVGISCACTPGRVEDAP